MNDLLRLLRYARPYSITLIAGILLTSLVGLFEAARIALVGPIFDSLAGNQLTNSVTQSNIFSYLNSFLPQINQWSSIAVLLLIFTLLKGIALFFSGYLLTYVGQKIIVKLRQELYEHILKQSEVFFTNHRSTDLTAHIINDVEKVQHAVTVLLYDTLRESFTLIALLICAFSISWKLSLFSLIVVPAIYAITVRFGRRLRQTSHKTQEGVQEVLGIAQETITNNRVVKAFGMEKFESARFLRSLEKLRNTNMKTASALYLSSPILEFVGFLLLAVLILFVQNLIAQGNFSIGNFTALLLALAKLYDPMRKLSQTQNTYQQIFAASTRVFTILDEHTEIVDKPIAKQLTTFQHQIELSNVSFYYPKSEQAALENINLTIKKGQMVALVGDSGSGKSTLTSLLMRFFDVSSGKILIDGIDIREFQLSSLRAQMALVSQHIALFNDTIYNNIAYGRSDISKEKVTNAAKAAYAHDFILERGGYEITVGENGTELAGGQRQRIAIARALLKNAPILILDEATSALDNKSERIVQEALNNLIEDRTTIVIAHRLSTIRQASQIVVLDQGKIVEIGTHEQLLAIEGFYHKLYQLQFAQDELNEELTLTRE
ncbi:MAG: ATP-binding cassette domain-containing protein [Acidobacteria bacterium]|nr:ATP-binding cassette domain-containing protein [Acidobacteriota bacterium]